MSAQPGYTIQVYFNKKDRAYYDKLISITDNASKTVGVQIPPALIAKRAIIEYVSTRSL